MILTKEEGPNEFGNKIFTFNTQYSLEVPAHYQVHQLIGRGSYGIVCSALNTITGEMVAIKKVSRLFEDAVICKRVLREVKILDFLNHPNVIGLRDLFTPPSPGNFTDFYLVTELMETNMLTLLSSPKMRLKAGHCQYFMLQLLSALQHIHSAHILHRDLKPSNILTDGDCNLKLCDFGLARGIADEMTQYVVTRWYRAPELLLVCGTYDYSIDMWSVGCLAAEMITGKTLLAGRDYIHQINLIIELLGSIDLKHELPDGTSSEAILYLESLPLTKGKPLELFCPELHRRFSEDSFFDSFEDTDTAADLRRQRSSLEYYSIFKDFLFGLLRYKPQARLTAKQAIAHAWFEDVRSGQADEPERVSNEIFSWKDDDVELSIAQLRQLFLEEIDKFHSKGKREA